MEETGNTWSGEMISLLCDMNKMRKPLMEQGITGFPGEEIRKYEQDYQDILAKGKQENSS